MAFMKLRNNANLSESTCFPLFVLWQLVTNLGILHRLEELGRSHDGHEVVLQSFNDIASQEAAIPASQKIFIASEFMLACL